ncbi:putative cyclin-dependent protein kinase inhibitor SMR [Helianthus anomalus]
MGFSKKTQADGDSKDGKKRWVIAGTSLRAPPLKSVSTKAPVNDEENDGNLGSGATTPTLDRSVVAECPPAPRKRRPVGVCHGNREFYSSPDMELFFKMALNSGRAKC